MLQWTQFSNVATLATYLIYPWLAHDVIGGHVGVLNNSEKVFWEFGATIMLNASYVFLFFCTPTWPSDHVSENQEFC